MYRNLILCPIVSESIREAVKKRFCQIFGWFLGRFLGVEPKDEGENKKTSRELVKVKDLFVLKSNGYFWAFDTLLRLSIGFVRETRRG